MLPRREIYLPKCQSQVDFVYIYLKLAICLPVTSNYQREIPSGIIQ